MSDGFQAHVCGTPGSHSPRERVDFATFSSHKFHGQVSWIGAVPETKAACRVCLPSLNPEVAQEKAEMCSITSENACICIEQQKAPRLAMKLKVKAFCHKQDPAADSSHPGQQELAVKSSGDVTIFR